jgi:hypothetical protein
LQEQPTDGRYVYDVPFPYINKDHVYCYINDDGQIYNLRWIDNNTVEIEADEELPIGTVFHVVRRTPKDDILVAFEGGQYLSHEGLTTNYLQILYALQEFFDGASDGSYVYRPIDMDIDAMLDALEGDITENLLGQDLFEKIELIMNIQSTQAEIVTNVEGHSSQINALATSVSENAVTAAQLQVLANENAAELSSLAQYVNETEGSMAAIEQVLFAGAQAMNTPENPADDTVLAEYTLKMDLDVNGQQRVAGFGMMLEQDEPSEFTIIADRFQIVDPNGTNIESATPVFTVGQVNGQRQCGIRGELIVEQTIYSSALRTGIIEVSHFSNAAKEDVENTKQQWEDIMNAPDSMVSGGRTLISPGSILLYGGDTLDNISAEDISETAHKKWAGNWTHTADETMIDGGKIYVGSQIQIGNEDGQSDYCFLDEGDIEFWQYVNGQHVLAKSLKRMEAGVCENGVTAYLSGKWKHQPSVIISPHELATYSSAYPNQSQVLQCAPINPEETYTGSGIWRFTPVARLVVASGIQTVVVDDSYSQEFSTHTYDHTVTFTEYNVQDAVNVSVNIVGKCWSYFSILNHDTQSYETHYGWINVTPKMRVYDANGWSGWYTGTKKACEKTSPGLWTLSSDNHTNITRIEIGLDYQGSDGYWAAEPVLNQPGVHIEPYMGSYTAEFSSTTELATGTLNYLAISQ